MNLQIHDEPLSFAKHAFQFLLKNEALNNLPIGVVGAIMENPAAYKEAPFLATVSVREETVAIGVMTPPYFLQVYTGDSIRIDALVLLANYFLDTKINLPGVIGPRAQAERFAEIWKQATRQETEVWRRMRVFQLDKVAVVPVVKGGIRLVEPGDHDLACAWFTEFNRDIGEEKTPEEIVKMVKDVTEKSSLYFWIDATGRPVSCACNLRKIVTGEVINLVYTPPEFRGNGFASACVATLSNRLLEAGARFCCLFTDLANPVSNKIYRRIGYEPIGDYIALRFIPNPASVSA